MLNKKRVLKEKYTICYCQGGSIGVGFFQTFCMQNSTTDE